MGIVSSRINFEQMTGINPGRRRRSQQDETLYSYSLNKCYFSNYFLMGGERFEIHDPDYLFGDTCDLNFLSCTKPHSLPYKQAQQNLLSALNTKQKAINKTSSRVSRLGLSPFNIFSHRHRQSPNSLRKQDAQTQTFNSSKNSSKSGSDPSQPLIMFLNIRKETLRLVKTKPNISNLENKVSPSKVKDCSTSNEPVSKVIGYVEKNPSRNCLSNSPHFKPQESEKIASTLTNCTSSADVKKLLPNDSVALHVDKDYDNIDLENVVPSSSRIRKFESEVSSLLSTTASSIKSGYTSIKDDVQSSGSNSSYDDDDDFKDALNETIKEDDDEMIQQHKSPLLNPPKGNRDITITIEPPDDQKIGRNSSDTASNRSGQADQRDIVDSSDDNNEKCSNTKPLNKLIPKRKTTKTSLRSTVSGNEPPSSSMRTYNIEFYFDSEVDCSIRIMYFCSRMMSSNGIIFKPKHSTYQSKIYYFKKGLNQKFEQPGHIFEPYLFEEDIFSYKPLDSEGNYNASAVFPLVIHCAALEGPTPRQSHSLLATIEKSSLDDSYSVKPLKQLIFVDGVQYILQDIYGIEHKQLSLKDSKSSMPIRLDMNNSSNNKTKLEQQRANFGGSNLNVCDTFSLCSFDSSLNDRQHRGSFISTNHKSLTTDSAFECVICMSEERDTMLLPCRHLCLCGSCAQSLRYQASSCPICRCPFKAALNLRPTQRRPTVNRPTTSTPTASVSSPSSKIIEPKRAVPRKLSNNLNNKDANSLARGNQQVLANGESDGSLEMRPMNIQWNKNNS